MSLEVIVGIVIAISGWFFPAVVRRNNSRIKTRGYIRELISLQHLELIPYQDKRKQHCHYPFIEFLETELRKTYYFWPFRKHPKKVGRAEYIQRKNNHSWLASKRSEWMETSKVKDFTPW